MQNTWANDIARRGVIPISLAMGVVNWHTLTSTVSSTNIEVCTTELFWMYLMASDSVGIKQLVLLSLT